MQQSSNIGSPFIDSEGQKIDQNTRCVIAVQTVSTDFSSWNSQAFVRKNKWLLLKAWDRRG